MAAYKRMVVKLGTGVLTSGRGELELSAMGGICSEIAAAQRSGTELILVSSGAVGLGMGKLGLRKRPKDICTLRTCAAVGQGVLIQTWGELFTPFGLSVAQILLTRNDVDSRSRNAATRELLDDLLRRKIVPVINENDCVSAAELNIKFGDNDVLSALVAALSKSDALAILSTAEGLANFDDGGKIVREVRKIDDSVRSLARGTKSATAVGGMITKIKAAEIATGSGCDVFIASGALADPISKILRGENPGTKFFAKSGSSSMNSKKRWLAYFGRITGRLFVDKGAAKALKEGGSLLPAGISEISGTFKSGDMLEIVDADSKEVVARGLAQMDSEEISKKMKVHPSRAGHKDVAVHRDNLALV